MENLETKLKNIIIKLDQDIELFNSVGGMDAMIERYQRDKIAFVSVLNYLDGRSALINSYPSIKEI